MAKVRLSASSVRKRVALRPSRASDWRPIAAAAKSIVIVIEKRSLGRSSAWLFAVGDANGAEHLDRADRHGKGGAPGATDRREEGQGGAVGDRQLGAVDLDQGVVDAGRGERRHQMLDGADPGLGPMGQREHGAETRVGHQIMARGDAGAAVVQRCEVGAGEDDAVIGDGPGGRSC